MALSTNINAGPGGSGVAAITRTIAADADSWTAPKLVKGSLSASSVVGQGVSIVALAVSLAAAIGPGGIRSFTMTQEASDGSRVTVSVQLDGAGSAPVAPVPVLAPGASYDGTAASGYLGAPPVKSGQIIPLMKWATHMGVPTATGITGGTIAPTAHFVFTDKFLPDGVIPDDGIIAVDVDDFDGDATVTFHCEGNSVAVGPDARSIVMLPVHGGSAVAVLPAVKLDVTTGDAVEIYAVVSSARAGYSDRVLGPIRLFRRSAPDRIISVGTGQATVAGVSYPTLQAAILYCSSNVADKWIKIRFVTDMNVDGGISYGTTNSVSNARRGMIEIDRNGHNVVVYRTTKGSVRPVCNGLVWRDIVFNMENIDQLFNEAGTVAQTIDYRPMWLVSCELYSTGLTEIFNNQTIRSTGLHGFGTALIGCYVHDTMGGDQVSFYRLGNRYARVGGDLIHVPGWTSATASGGATFAKFNDFSSCTVEGVRAGVDALRGTYSGGGGAGTFEVSGGTHNGSGRSLIVKVNGATVATIAISVTVGTAPYSMAELAAAAQAGAANWVFTALDNSRRAATLGNEIGATVVASGAAMKSHFWSHADGVQLNQGTQHDNMAVHENVWRDCELQTFPKMIETNPTKACYNSSYRNNVLLYRNDNGQAAPLKMQIAGVFKNTRFVNNSHPNQDMLIVWGNGTSFDAHSRIANNIFNSMAQTGTVGTADVSHNHVYASNAIPAATDTTIGGSFMTDFPALAAISFTDADVTPSVGATIRSSLKPAVARYDRRGKKRAALDMPGAIAA